MKLRLLITVLLIVSVFIVPWYISLILLAIATFAYSYYFEAVLIGFIFDSVFGQLLQSPFLDSVGYQVTIATIILIPIVNWIRSNTILR